MNKQPNNREAEALDALLDGKTFNPADLDGQDASLAAEIRALAQSAQPDDSRFYNNLHQKLLAAGQKRRRGWTFNWQLAGSLAGAAALMALVLFSILIIPRLLGQPDPQTGAPAQGVGSLPTATATGANAQPMPQPTPTQVGPAGGVVPSGESTGGLALNTGLPDGPASAPRYYQIASGEALNAQSAQAAAARLGVNGPVYAYQGEGGNSTYQVSDGVDSVLFFGTTTAEFTYSTSLAPAAQQGGQPPAFESLAERAVTWLNERGLLDFEYQAAACPTDDWCVAIHPVLAGIMVREDNPYDARINVRFDPSGQVKDVFYRPLSVESSASQEILSAAQAYELVQSGEITPRAFFQTLDFTNQRSLRTWQRVYQTGEAASLYGYAVAIQPVNAGDPPYVFINGLPVQGQPQLAAQIPMRKALHVWGVVSSDSAGHVWLELQGWEAAQVEIVDMNGQIVSENGALRFKNEAGELFELPGLPADVPQGAPLTASGAKTAPGQFEWRYIQTQIGNDNNRQIGQLPIPGMPLDQQDVPPVLPETGYQPGDRVEVTGSVFSAIRVYPDGSQEMISSLNVAPESNTGVYWTAHLVGAGAQGIEVYHQLPVTVSGQYLVVNGELQIEVERYEALYPEVRVAAWFGKVNERGVGGQTVLTLTDDAGQEWVLNSSLNFPQSLASMGWEAGTEIAVEGYPAQGSEAQFGGLPVLMDLQMTLLNLGGITRENYQMGAGVPLTELAPEAADNRLPAGSITAVELVYSAQAFHGSLPEDALARQLLPFWKFSGALADGRPFELLVLASK